MLVHVFNLARVYVGHRELDGTREVDDRFPVRGRFPDIQNRVADLQCVFRLCSGEALRAVLEPVIRAGLFGQFFEHHRSVDGDLTDLFL